MQLVTHDYDYKYDFVTTWKSDYDYNHTTT